MSDGHGAAQAQERHGLGDRPGHRGEKKLIEDAYTLGEQLGLAVWCTDQAGPFQTIPCAGTSWQPEGKPARQPHEYTRQGTAKVLTLFHPQDGAVHLEGVTSCPNTLLHGWLKQEISAILDEMPAVDSGGAAPLSDESVHAVEPCAFRADWERWQAGLMEHPTLPSDLPPLRMLLILDNLAGHKTPEFVLWLFSQGIMPLYTPLGGSWLNMAESIQRILKRRALEGEHPTDTEQIIAWFEAAARGWNKAPTPFEWGGKRAARRQRARERRHALGGSGAYTRVPIRQWKMAA